MTIGPTAISFLIKHEVLFMAELVTNSSVALTVLFYLKGRVPYSINKVNFSLQTTHLYSTLCRLQSSQLHAS
jgi:hypothetical protein